MNQGLAVVTPPAVEPISLAEAKAQARVDYSDDDALIEQFIRVARASLERITNRAFITQTLRLTMMDWPDGDIVLPAAPLQAVVAVRYTDDGGAVHTVDPGAYAVVTGIDPGRVVPKSGWPGVPRPGGVQVEFVAGYGSQPGDVPGPLRHAMLLLVAHMYDNRAAIRAPWRIAASNLAWFSLNDLPYGVRWLIEPYRVRGFQ